MVDQNILCHLRGMLCSHENCQRVDFFVLALLLSEQISKISICFAQKICHKCTKRFTKRCSIVSQQKLKILPYSSYLFSVNWVESDAYTPFHFSIVIFKIEKISKFNSLEFWLFRCAYILPRNVNSCNRIKPIDSSRLNEWRLCNICLSTILAWLNQTRLLRKILSCNSKAGKRSLIWM